MPEPIWATFISNEGKQYPQKPEEIYGKWWIGAREGRFFKMIALDREGKYLSCRYTENYPPKSIDGLLPRHIDRSSEVTGYKFNYRVVDVKLG